MYLCLYLINKGLAMYYAKPEEGYKGSYEYHVKDVLIFSITGLLKIKTY